MKVQAAPAVSWREEAVLTILQAGTVLGVARSTAYAMAQRGELPLIAVGGRKKVPVVALRRLLGELPGGAA